MNDEAWWLTKSAAAKRLGVTKDILKAMIAARQIETVRLGGRDVLRTADVERLREQLQGAEAEA